MTYRSDRDHAVHVLASYFAEHLLRRKTKDALVTAELEIRDALLTFLAECEKSAAVAARAAIRNALREFVKRGESS